MGDQRESGQAWGAYMAFICAIVMVVSAGSARSVFGTTPACQPVLLDVTGLPADVLRDLHEAAARTTAASNVPFVFVKGAADTDAVRVAVSTELPVAPRGKQTVGHTSVETSARGRRGTLLVNVALTTGGGFNRRRDVGAVLLHELGHVLGLPHSGNPADLMFGIVNDAAASWSDNDRARLQREGARRHCDAPITGSRRS